MRVGVGANRRQHGLAALGLAQIALHLVHAARQGMDVGILEARQEQPPTEVDDPGRRADRRRDLAGAPDGGDPISVDGDRLRRRPRRVDGVDVAPGEDDVGGSVWHHAHDGTRRRVARSTAHRAERPA